jgi:hypothetical protein
MLQIDNHAAVVVFKVALYAKKPDWCAHTCYNAYRLRLTCLTNRNE